MCHINGRIAHQSDVLALSSPATARECLCFRPIQAHIAIIIFSLAWNLTGNITSRTLKARSGLAVNTEPSMLGAKELAATGATPSETFIA